MIKKTKNSFFFGLIQRVNITYHHWRNPFKVNNEWFEQLFTKHFTIESQSKYNSELFQDQLDQGQAILDQITLGNSSNIVNQIRILTDWIADFERDYEEMLTFFKRENITINQSSIQHKQFELFISKKSKLREDAEKWKNVFQKNDLEAIINLELINIPYDFDHQKMISIRDYQHHKLNEYSENEKYLKNPPIKEDWHYIEYPFRRLKEINDQLNFLGHHLYQIHTNKINIITGDAGMGKSNLSAYLTLKLREGEFPVIFIRAKAFNGNPDEFEAILLRELDIPLGYNLTEVLEKLSKYGKENKKRITIIIDALNESTFQNQGFSSIWRNHLDTFLSRLNKYPYLVFIATLRNSYIERIWSSGEIPYKTIPLQGFSQKIIVQVVQNYFNIYNINHGELKEEDIFYFRTPLLLFLYCEMLNSKKVSGINASLGLSGFQEVFERYINNLSKEIKTDLELPSVNRISQGFSRISEKMRDEIQAFVETDEFYNLFEGEEVKNINGTIGHKILEGYLIYVKDSFNKQDVITHTQQEVGGYLLAKYLIESLGKIENVIASSFFKNHIIGKIEDKHQLADDIIKFLLTDDTTTLILLDLGSEHPVLKEFILNLLQREPKSSKTKQIKDRFFEKSFSPEDTIALFNASKSRILDENSFLNLFELKDLLLSLSNQQFELSWTKLLYDKWAEVIDFIDFQEEYIKDWKTNVELSDNNKLFIEYLIFILESTNRNHRDKASILLLEITCFHYDYILDRLKEFLLLHTNRLYIIDRLTGIIYGAILRKQNDSIFISTKLKSTAETFYQYQFGSNPKNPVFHYGVIDSMKHVIDLSIEKKVFRLGQSELNALSNYQFENTGWPNVSGTRIAEFNQCGYSAYTHKCPDPFKMDFVIYTVPRLVEEGNEVKKVEALANIYQRLIDSGYIPKNYNEIKDKKEAEFYFGTSPFLIKTKVDRLGKKYSWNAFFEYAGYLLSQNQLRIWSEYETRDKKPIYERLGDVEFEVSNPNPNLSLIQKPIYKGNLLDVKSNDQSWVKIPKFDILWDIWKNIFDQQEYTLLYGYIENKPDAEYKVRSFLTIDSFLVKKENIQKDENDLNNLIVDWKHELYGSKTISRTYFGELYWADNIPDVEPTSNSIELNKSKEIERVLTVYDIINSGNHEEMNPGDLIKETKPIQIHFDIEPTIADYLWERDTDSGAQESFRENIPSPQIGKYLKLKADVERFQFLDEELKIATKSVYWDNKGKDNQHLNYLRSDLLEKYMKENNLVLLYEVKQFTHDQTILENGGQVDMRKIKYFLPHLSEK